MSELISEEQLKKWAKCSSKADLVAFLVASDIEFFTNESAGTICTTTGLIEKAKTNNNQEWRFGETA